MSDVKVGDVLILKGRTLKGKNRVREHGERWKVVETATPREFLQGRLAIVPVKTPKMPYLRFFDPLHDEHLEIVKVEDED